LFTRARSTASCSASITQAWISTRIGGYRYTNFAGNRPQYVAIELLQLDGGPASDPERAAAKFDAPVVRTPTRPPGPSRWHVEALRLGRPIIAARRSDVGGDERRGPLVALADDLAQVDGLLRLRARPEILDAQQIGEVKRSRRW